MHALVVTLVVVGICLLAFQAFSLLTLGSARADQFWTALLTASIATLIALNLYASSKSLLLTDLESGQVLVQGHAEWLLRAMAFGIPMVTTLGLQSAAAAHDKGHRAHFVLGMGLALSTISAWTVSARGPTDLPVSTLYAYDLFAPWLLLWVAACMLDWMLVVVGLHERVWRRWLTATLCLGIAAIGARSFPEGTLRGQWTFAYWCTFALALLFGLPVLFNVLAPKFFAHHQRFRRALLIVLVVGLFSAFLRFIDELSSTTAQDLTSISCFAFVLASLGWMVHRTPWKDADFRAKIFHKQEGTFVRTVLVLSLLALALLALDLYFTRFIPELWNLLCSAVFAIMLVELAAEGPLNNVRAEATLWGSSSTVSVTLQAALRVCRWLGARVRLLISKVDSLSLAPRIVVKALVPLLVFVLLDELSSARRTVVQTFEVYGAKDDKSDAGRRLAELVVNRLNGIALDLDENMLIALPAALQAQAGDPKESLEQAAVHTSDLEADLSSDVIDLGPLGKLRVGVVAKFLQKPVRALIGARYVDGALIEQDGGYRVVAHSSTGESWTYPLPQAPPLDLLALAEQLAFSIVSSDAEWMQRGMTLDAEAFEDFLDGTWAQQTLEQLAGNERSERAIQDLVFSMRAAVAKDPAFAVAHYRLALALSRQKQYGNALIHLRAALKARPNFGPAQDALARLLERGLEPDSPLLQRAMFDRTTPANPVALAGLRHEARERWSSMVEPSPTWSLRDRAAAHLGLCTLELDQLASPREAPPPDKWNVFAHAVRLLFSDPIARATPTPAGEHKRPTADEGKEPKLPLARVDPSGIFNCSLAVRLYSALPGEEIESRDKNSLIANAYNALGVLRSPPHPPDQHASVADSKHSGCSAAQFTISEQAPVGGWTLPSAPGDARTSALFRLAHALAPDDSTIACNLATSECAQGSWAGLDRLRNERETQLTVCRGLLSAAVDGKGSQAHFRAALRACDRAIESAPRNAEALTQYAEAFRLWWHKFPELDQRELESGEVATKAERRARDAVQLAQNSPSEGQPAFAAATLGAVLLARGRPHEGLPWLERAAKYAADRELHLTEVDLGLAEALLCAHQEDVARGDTHAHACPSAVGRAELLLLGIREREALLESGVFASEGKPIDRHALEQRCAQAVRSPRVGQKGKLARAIPTYPLRHECGTKLLRVSAPSGSGLQVHLWGDGEDLVRPAANFSYVLSARDTHGLYFAQLIDEHAAPLSEPVPLDTFGVRDPHAAGAGAITAPECDDAERVLQLAFASP